MCKNYSVKGQRELHIVTPENMCNIGIYMLNFNSYFYIGRSINMYMRMVVHNSIWKQVLNPDHKMYGKGGKVFNYLVRRPKLKYVFLSILEECEEDNIQQREQYWLDKYIDNPKCLNAFRKASRLYRKDEFYGTNFTGDHVVINIDEWNRNVWSFKL